MGSQGLPQRAVLYRNLHAFGGEHRQQAFAQPLSRKWLLWEAWYAISGNPLVQSHDFIKLREKRKSCNQNPVPRHHSRAFWLKRSRDRSCFFEKIMLSMPYLRDPSRANGLIFMILCNLICNLQYIRDAIPTARVLRVKTIYFLSTSPAPNGWNQFRAVICVSFR